MTLLRPMKGLRSCLDILRTINKKFKTIEFYREFYKLDSKMNFNSKLGNGDSILTGSYLDEDDVQNMRLQEDSKDSVALSEIFDEAIEVIPYIEKEDSKKVKEFNYQKERVR